jgi:hypothetical protein
VDPHIAAPLMRLLVGEQRSEGVRRKDPLEASADVYLASGPSSDDRQIARHEPELKLMIVVAEAAKLSERCPSAKAGAGVLEEPSSEDGGERARREPCRRDVLHPHSEAEEKIGASVRVAVIR